jgi:hypothetical protein
VRRRFPWVGLGGDDDVSGRYREIMAVGPTMGRPLVDTLEHSELRNLKELRPGSRGRSEIRMLFVFDPDRAAIFLVAGDKAGQWSRWYEESIPLAEARYADYRAEMDKEAGR